MWVDYSVIGSTAARFSLELRANEKRTFQKSGVHFLEECIAICTKGTKPQGFAHDLDPPRELEVLPGYTRTFIA